MKHPYYAPAVDTVVIPAECGFAATGGGYTQDGAGNYDPNKDVIDNGEY